MIRDPSDGSVKEINGAVKEINGLAAKKSSKGITLPVIETSTSGLAILKAKAEYLARLEKSRDWLKDYFKPKGES